MTQMTKELRRIRENQRRQAQYRFGPEYRPALRADRGEVAERGLSGTLPAVKLGRHIQAMANPEKFVAALLLYNPALFELHEQHVHYPSAKTHPLAHHHRWSHLPWPTTDGTFVLADRLGFSAHHPKAWNPEKGDGQWEIGAWIGDFLGFFQDQYGPYVVFYEVKDRVQDHGQPGGSLLNRHIPQRVNKAQARRSVCSAYAEQLGSWLCEVSSEELPAKLAITLLQLCRSHDKDVLLPESAVAELLQAFKEAVGTDEPARHVAKRLVSRDADLDAAKNLLQIAVWQRQVRVDLYEPVLFDHPLLPEHTDVLVEYAHLFQRAVCRH